MIIVGCVRFRSKLNLEAVLENKAILHQKIYSGHQNERSASECFFSPPPSPSSFFALTPTVRVTISTLPNLPLSQNQRWRLHRSDPINKLSPTQNTPALQARENVINIIQIDVKYNSNF